jgi:methyl-accepting chemotaxis protein
MEEITITITLNQEELQCMFVLMSGAQLLFPEMANKVLQQIKPHLLEDFAEKTVLNFHTIKELIDDNDESIQKLTENIDIVAKKVNEKVEKIESGIIDNANDTANCFDAIIELTKKTSREIIEKYDVYPGDRFEAKISKLTKIAYFTHMASSGKIYSLGVSDEMYIIIR